MGRKQGLFGIIGIVCLVAFALVGHFSIADRRTTLADIGRGHSFRSFVTADIATAEAADEAQAAEAIPGPEREDMLRRLDERESDLLGEVADRSRREGAASEDEVSAPPDTRLEDAIAAKQNLESQQEVLISEVLKLKKQLSDLRMRKEEVPEPREIVLSEGDDDVAALQSELSAWKQKASKERANLKLLADHILKLREELRATRAELNNKTAELNSKAAELDGKSGDLRGQAEQISRLTQESENAKKLDDDNRVLTAEIENIRSQRDSLGTQLQEEQKKTLALEQAVDSLRGKVQSMESERALLSTSAEKARDDLGSRDEELEETKRQLSKTIEDARVCGATLEEKLKSLEQLPSLESRLNALKTAGEEKEREIAALKTQLADKEQIASGIPALKKELLAAKNQLLMKEKEQRLLGGGKPETAERLHDPHLQAERDRLLEQSGKIAGEESLGKRPATITSDVTIAVVKDRVALRSGPSPDHSELMPVGKGTQLTVEERDGDWYRIIAPNSTRAYIRADMVRVIPPGGEAAVRSNSAPARAPAKRPLKATPSDSAMEPFGDVPPKGDRIDRAFHNLKKGLESEKEAPPSPPAILE